MHAFISRPEFIIQGLGTGRISVTMKDKAIFLVIINVSLMLGSYLDRHIEEEFENFVVNDLKNSEVYHPYKIWRSLISLRPRNPRTYSDKSSGINSVGFIKQPTRLDFNKDKPLGIEVVNKASR